MRLYQISGSQATLLYDHASEPKPRAGDSYLLKEIGTNNGLIVQVVALESFNYPSLSEVLMRQLMEESYGEKNVQTFLEEKNVPSVDSLSMCIAKIRLRVTDKKWQIWNGWIPARNVEIGKVDDIELLKHCNLLEPKNPLHVGQTLDGHTISISGRSFEKINIITSMKGMGKSYLAKIIMLELIERGMPCLVFDLNKEYLKLPQLEHEKNDPKTVEKPGVIILSAAKDFRITIESFGKRAFLNLFGHYNPTENTRNLFETRVNQLFEQLEQIDEHNSGQKEEKHKREKPFVNLETIRSQFPAPPKTNEHIRNAIMDRLEAIEGLNLFVEKPEEATSFDERYNLICQKGGAIVVDLSHLSSKFARDNFVKAVIDMLERVAQRCPKLPFAFFEEAHLYVEGHNIDNLVTRARHLGITSTFITNMVTGLNESVLRQADNVFLLYLPHKDDVKNLSKSALTDEDTIVSFAQRIPREHALLIGNATNNYPIVFKVKTRDDVKMAGETKYAFPE